MANEKATAATNEVLASLQSWVESIVDQRLSNVDVGRFKADPRALRQARGMELTELAAKAGVSHGTLSRLEAGKLVRPKPITISRLANALGVSAVDYREAVALLIQRSKMAM